jgi:hypothetical protein
MKRRSTIQIGNKVYELDYFTGRKRLVREIDFQPVRYERSAEGWRPRKGNEHDQ